MSEISPSPYYETANQPYSFLFCYLQPILIGFLIPPTRIFFDPDEKHTRLDQAASLSIHNFLPCFVFLFGLGFVRCRWKSSRGAECVHARKRMYTVPVGHSLLLAILYFPCCYHPHSGGWTFCWSRFSGLQRARVESEKVHSWGKAPNGNGG